MCCFNHVFSEMGYIFLSDMNIDDISVIYLYGLSETESAVYCEFSVLYL